MEQLYQNRVFEVAEKYYSTVSNVLERNGEWWQVAQSGNEGNYGRVIILSLDAAGELFRNEIELVEGIRRFSESVSDVYDMTMNRDKISKMSSNVNRPGDPINDEINAVARQTLNQLNEAEQSVVSESPEPAPHEDQFDAKEIQTALKSLGFFNSFIDGVAGPQTKAAIRKFQTSKGLIATGEVDRKTYNLMMTELNPEQTNPKQEQQKLVNNLLLPLLKTEGNHQSTDDKLDFEYDIQSLATVISLEDVKPPLAIGLFGNWGSGKSFFMEKLSKKIQDYSDLKTDGFVQNVVQVKFNSWHYSDSNLWASLITEIFDSLNTFSTKEKKEDELAKLSDTLNITSAQREAVEAKRNQLTDKIEKLIREKAVKRSRLEDISGIGILRLLLSDKNISADLKSLQNEDVEHIIQDGKKLEEYLAQLSEQKGKFLNAVSILRIMKGKRWAGVLIATVILFAAVMIVRYYFKDEWGSVTQWIAGIVALVAANVGNAFRILMPVKREFNEAVDRLSSLKETFDTRPEVQTSELDEMKTEVDLLTLSIADLDKKIVDARKEIDDLKSGRKLLDFIEARQRDESYSKQLGLISWIRKDFSKLDELLRKQHELSKEEKEKTITNPYDVQLRIDRIILYIDDLDRCKEEIVVKVLEAIHLLLAFPLFVVVVGVDPRWLNNALSEKYKNLFGKHYSSASEKKTATDEDLLLSGAATSYDYLEKIFQIPFSLRQINATGRKNLIEYLLRNEMEKSPEPIDNDANVKVPDIIDLDTLISQTSETNRKSEQRQTKVEIEERRERLTFLKDELECMQNISALFGHSPRTINRFVNIYRIIKAHRKLKVSGEFSEDDFAPIMLILSIMIGHSELAQDFIDQLSQTSDRILFQDFLDKTKFPAKFKNEITDSIHARVAQLPVKSFKDNLELISRFSFRTFAVTVE